MAGLMSSIVNIAAYHFAPLSGLPELRGELFALCKANQLRGTILLSPEGVNVFAAGRREGIDALVTRLRAIPGVEQIEVKESFSDDRPFNRMLVKIKKEIIAFGVDGIAPGRYTSRRLEARELKRWLDEGRPVTLLDTRNTFEVDAGTFANAVAIGVDDFRDFPAAVARLPEELKRQPIVTFCTGGIRCEKAAPFMERAGFNDIYQLHGGILKYFEECGGAHYDGDCFVFDKRVALNAKLEASGLGQCFACQAILSADELKSPKYVEGVSCPRCHKTEIEARQVLVRERNAALAALLKTLPGAEAYDNIRPISVPLRLDGYELIDFLEAMRTHLSRDEWMTAAGEQRLICRDEPIQAGRIMRAGERVYHHMPATREPDVARDVHILHEDEALVVVHKPAPLPMHPCGRFNRNSLSYVLDQVYAPLHLRPAHRLDADTSGVVVFAKNRAVARVLQKAFEAGEVEKRYLALVHGTPAEERFECHLPIETEPGDRGIRLPSETGAPASTRFSVKSQFENGTTLLDVHPLTGRTNQIRAHLWALGWPIVGDPIYRMNYELGVAKSLDVNDAPLCLHAAEISFVHPITRVRVTYMAENSTWGRHL